MNPEKRLIDRIESLIITADAVLATHKPNPTGYVGFSTLDSESFQAWKASSENIIKLVSGSENSYYQNFLKETKRGEYIDCVKSGKGILRALKDDIDAGLITTVRSLAFAEVFSDLLEMAEYLLVKGYKDPAASLLGAILEDSLRKIAESKDIKFTKNDGLDSLNNKLLEANIYSKLTQKQIDSWRVIRNSADHGKFSEYKKEDVEDMSRGVTRFIAEYI